MCALFTRECTRGGFCNFMHLKPISHELRRELYGRGGVPSKRKRSVGVFPDSSQSTPAGIADRVVSMIDYSQSATGFKTQDSGVGLSIVNKSCVVFTNREECNRKTINTCISLFFHRDSLGHLLNRYQIDK